MKKICYIIPSLSIGGTERQLVYLINGMSREYHVMVVCTHHEGGFVGDARRAGANVIVLPTRGGWDFSLMWKLRSLFRERQPDIMHSFLFGFDLFANMAARRARIPVVISSRRQLGTWRKFRHVMMQRLSNHYVDCAVANSQSVAQFAIRQEKMNPSFYRVIRNGIEPGAFISKADNRTLRLRYKLPFNVKIIGMVANFSPVKDHELFVDAAYELLRRRSDVHFLMVGAGPLVPAIERQIQRGGTPECFTRVSAVNEIADLYSLMDVSVMCSQVEGFPNAVIESMASGTPVVAASVGGITELVRHRQTGLLVESRQPRDFADAIEDVLNSPDQSGAMAARAQTFVDNELNVDRMIHSYRALYTELLEQKGRR